MHVLEGAEDLVHDVLLVHLLQDVGTDDGMQVRLHVLKHQVDVAAAGKVVQTCWILRKTKRNAVRGPSAQQRRSARAAAGWACELLRTGRCLL